MTATELETLCKFQTAELLKAQRKLDSLNDQLIAAEAVNQERLSVIAEQAAKIEELAFEIARRTYEAADRAAEIERLRRLLPEVGNEVALPSATEEAEWKWVRREE